MEKPTLCPQCKDPKLTLWHNRGIGKNNRAYENWKCKCGYLKWAEKKDVPVSNKPAQDAQPELHQIVERIASRLTMLEAIVNGSKGMGVVGIDERLIKIENIVKKDKAVFYPTDDEIKVKDIPF